jgi:hypothetical protein
MSSLAGEGGESLAGNSDSQAGAAGAESVADQAGGATVRGGASGMSGTSASGGASGMSASGGAGGTPMGCAVTHRLVAASADAWIDAAKPSTNYGSEPQLIILGGPSEQRALLAFDLSPVNIGQELKAATLALRLLAPSAVFDGPRAFQLHALAQPFTEGRVTWNNYSAGAAKKWNTPGGDFAAAFGSGTLDPGATILRLDATLQVQLALATQQSEFAGLVLEQPSTAVGAAALTFGSREGSSTLSPVLDLEFCVP